MMSIRPYPTFHSGSYRPIFKFLFLFERYGMRDLTFILFVSLSVRPFIRPFVHPSVTYIFHFSLLQSDFQNSFFVWKVWHERRNCYNFCPHVRLFICPSVCPYPFLISLLQSDFQNSFFVWKVWHQIPSFNNFCRRPSVYLSVPYSPFNFCSVPSF